MLPLQKIASVLGSMFNHINDESVTSQKKQLHPHEYNCKWPLTDEEGNLLLECESNEEDQVYRLKYQKLGNLPGIPAPYVTNDDYTWLMNNWIPRSNDIFIIAHPKCGQTWVQQICTTIMYYYEKRMHIYNSNNSKININTDYYYNDSHNFAVPNSQHVSFAPEVLIKDKTKFDTILDETQNTLMFWKTHASFDSLPIKKKEKSIAMHTIANKYIIVIRNPKDALVSFRWYLPQTPVMRFDKNAYSHKQKLLSK